MEFEYTKEELLEDHYRMIAEIESLRSQLDKARRTCDHYYVVIQALEEEIESLS